LGERTVWGCGSREDEMVGYAIAVPVGVGVRVGGRLLGCS